jgi:hypothetical protein
MKLWPNTKDNSLAYSGQWNTMATPVELNDGIYFGNVRHDKNTLTPFFNSLVPLLGRYNANGSQVGTTATDAHQLFLPFSCCRALMPQQHLYRPGTQGNHSYTAAWCDHEWQCKGEARRKGINGYSIVTSNDEEIFMGPSSGRGYGAEQVRKNKDSHLDFSVVHPTLVSNHGYYYGSSCFPMDENLQKGEPNILVTGHGAYSTQYRGMAAMHAPNTGSADWTAGILSYYSGSYTYTSTNFKEYLAPQFLCRSADYVFFSVSAMQRSSNGLAMFWIYRYNKASATITQMYYNAVYNNSQIFGCSNSITDENDPNREILWIIHNTSTVSSNANYQIMRVEINKSTGTVYLVSQNPPGGGGASNTVMPAYHYYSANNGAANRPNLIVSEIGKAGVDVPSGTVDHTRDTYGTADYRVVGDSITYNSTAYAVGKLVTGVSGQTSYTGSGKLQTVSTKALSLFNTWQYQHSPTSFNSYFSGWTGEIPNADLSTTMYNGSMIGSRHNTNGDGVPSDSASYGLGPGDLVNGDGTGQIYALCALDPYYNKILVLSNENAAILQIGVDPTSAVNQADFSYWTLVKRFPGKYHGGGMDSTGRLYLQKDAAPYELHMYTTDIPAQVSITTAKNSYTYSGTTINTLLSAQATNFEDAKVATSLKLKISGSAAEFTDGSKSITITTNTTTVNEVNFNVVAGGYFKIDAQAVSS